MLFVRCAILLLLLYTNNSVSMIVNINTFSTLQELCINAVRKIVTTDDVYDLMKKDTFEKYSNLPEPLKEKIAAFPMFKLGHEYTYKTPGSGIFDSVYLDEDNNHVRLISKNDKNDKKLTIFKMGETEKINFFEGDIFSFAHNRSLMCWSSGMSSIIHLLKNGIQYDTFYLPHEYGYPYKIFKNQRTLNLLMGRGQLLFDLDTKSLLIEDFAQHIQFDVNETVCLIKYFNEVFTLYNTKNPANYQKIKTFNNLKNAVINPNGKNILIETQDNKCALISITGKTLFEIEDDTNVHCACFNDTGDYVIASHYSQKNGLRYNLINTNNGVICFSLTPLHRYSAICFYQKFLIIIDDNNTAYLIRIKDLPMINNGLYTLDDIKKFNRVYSFENVDYDYCRDRSKSYLFHPSGNYIITRKNGLWKLIHIKSQECVATLTNVLKYHFSQPTGKMLYIEDGYRRWYKVFYCRNDFTLEEILLNRLIAKNNGDHSIISQYPYLQEIYNTMDKDKQNFNDISKPASFFTLKNVGIIVGLGTILGITSYFFSKHHK